MAALPRDLGPVPADGSGPPTSIVIVPAVDEAPAGEWGTRTVSAGLAVNLDAAILVDAGTRALLQHLRESILTGQRPDGGGPQKPLSARALADPDRESPHRAYNTGELADGIFRTAIASNGSSATSTVKPPRSRSVYVAAESGRGISLITGAGAAGKAAVDAARAAGVLMGKGREVEVDRGGLEAPEASK